VNPVLGEQRNLPSCAESMVRLSLFPVDQIYILKYRYENWTIKYIDVVSSNPAQGEVYNTMW
jgi:hypothetical protein